MPAQAGASINLGGELHKLRITWRALEALETDHGISLEALGVQMQDPTQRLRAVRMVVWLGMLHSNPDLTVGALTDMLDDADPVEVMEAAAELLRERFRSAFEGNGGRPSSPTGGRKKRKKAGR
jgi:hypothetical protein